MSTQKKLIEVALPLEAINQESARKVDSPWASFDTSSVVGKATVGFLSGCVICISGR
jgi:hypothetical protein